MEVRSMARGPLPTLVHKIACGRKLEALREKSVLSQEEVARKLGWSQPKVGNIEGAVSGIKDYDLDKLLDLYDVDEQLEAELRELATSGRDQWPRRKGLLRNRFDGKMRAAVDMENSASTMCRHNSMTIPGLLQTKEYMRHIFRAYRPAPTRDQIDEFTENRLERQRVLDNNDQRFWFVIHEAALRSLESIDGDRSVLHLMEVIDRPNVEVQIAPFRHGHYPGQEENYALFGFDTSSPVEVTYVEKYDGVDLLYDEKNLNRFKTFWDYQRVHALGPEQTRPFLREMARSS
jgi:transcriptional regulator with XRE-family HTH domain